MSGQQRSEAQDAPGREAVCLHRPRGPSRAEPSRCVSSPHPRPPAGRGTSLGRGSSPQRNHSSNSQPWRCNHHRDPSESRAAPHPTPRPGARGLARRRPQGGLTMREASSSSSRLACCTPCGSPSMRIRLLLSLSGGMRTDTLYWSLILFTWGQSRRWDAAPARPHASGLDPHLPHARIPRELKGPLARATQLWDAAGVGAAGAVEALKGPDVSNEETDQCAEKKPLSSAPTQPLQNPSCRLLRMEDVAHQVAKGSHLPRGSLGKVLGRDGHEREAALFHMGLRRTTAKDAEAGGAVQVRENEGPEPAARDRSCELRRGCCTREQKAPSAQSCACRGSVCFGKPYGHPNSQNQKQVSGAGTVQAGVPRAQT